MITRNSAFNPGWAWKNSKILRALSALTPGTLPRSAIEARSISFSVPKWCSKARLRDGPMPGISCRPASRMSFLRSLRCEPITKRCASSRSRWMKYSTGSRGSSLIASRSGMNRVSRPASRSGPLATAISETWVSPSASKISLTALSWPRPPSMMTRSGHCGNESSSALALAGVAFRAASTAA